MSEEDTPKIVDVNEVFWSGAARGEFLLQRDPKTGNSQFFPRPVNVFAEAIPEWTAATGGGTLIAVTTARTSGAPYQVGLIQLDEGPRVFSRVLKAAADIRPGRKMRLIWDGERDGRRLYAFEPA